MAGKPRKIADLLHHEALAAHGEHAGKAAERHDHIDDHVEHHALNTLLRSRGEADECIADVADGGVSQQALDVALADGSERTERH